MLEDIFPNLSRGGYQITSPRDRDYNCIAWAVGDIANWWWPGSDPSREYWPRGVVREITLTAFVEALTTLGYVSCDTEEHERGHVKIALFANSLGVPTHAAWQLPSGRWTSKLGQAQDIEHDLHDLSGEVYGKVVLIMKRSEPIDPPGVFP